MPELNLPTARVHASYLAAIEEYRAEGGYPDFDDLDVRAPSAFADYVSRLRRDPRARVGVDAALPMMTLLWWIDGDDYLGRISIWHQLTGEVAGTGHVGYDIRPSARSRGHATRMLRAALPVAAELGIDPAVVTVRIGNHASRRVIEANGGLLVDTRADHLRFHLPTTHATATYVD